jgi:hypothetical protein
LTNTKTKPGIFPVEKIPGPHPAANRLPCQVTVIMTGFHYRIPKDPPESPDLVPISFLGLMFTRIPVPVMWSFWIIPEDDPV